MVVVVNPPNEHYCNAHLDERLLCRHLVVFDSMRPTQGIEVRRMGRAEKFLELILFQGRGLLKERKDPTTTVVDEDDVQIDRMIDDVDER